MKQEIQFVLKRGAALRLMVLALWIMLRGHARVRLPVE